MNTGWTGGPYGTGERMNIDHTRSMVRAALGGAARRRPVRDRPDLRGRGPDVLSRTSRPRSSSRARRGRTRRPTTARPRALARMFADNFRAFADGAAPEVRAAGPRVVDRRPRSSRAFGRSRPASQDRREPPRHVDEPGFPTRGRRLTHRRARLQDGRARHRDKRVDLTGSVSPGLQASASASWVSISVSADGREGRRSVECRAPTRPDRQTTAPTPTHPKEPQAHGPQQGHRHRRRQRRRDHRPADRGGRPGGRRPGRHRRGPAPGQGARPGRGGAGRRPRRPDRRHERLRRHGRERHRRRDLRPRPAAGDEPRRPARRRTPGSSAPS